MRLHVNRKGVGLSWPASGPYGHTLAISLPRGARGWGALYYRSAPDHVFARGWGADRLRRDPLFVRRPPLILRAI
jgi:hypothetical protein